MRPVDTPSYTIPSGSTLNYNSIQTRESDFSQPFSSPTANALRLRFTAERTVEVPNRNTALKAVSNGKKKKLR